jgi:hypothetical protein
MQFRNERETHKNRDWQSAACYGTNQVFADGEIKLISLFYVRKPPRVANGR